jgi:hypothetical protein
MRKKLRPRMRRIKPKPDKGDTSGTPVTPVGERWKTVRFACLALAVTVTVLATGEAEDGVLTGSFLAPLLR